MRFKDGLEAVGVDAFVGLDDRVFEEGLVPVKRELVHGVDNGQIEKYEVESGGYAANRPVVLTVLHDLLHGDLERLGGCFGLF